MNIKDLIVKKVSSSNSRAYIDPAFPSPCLPTHICRGVGAQNIFVYYDTGTCRMTSPEALAHAREAVKKLDPTLQSTFYVLVIPKVAVSLKALVNAKNFESQYMSDLNKYSQIIPVIEPPVVMPHVSHGTSPNIFNRLYTKLFK